MCLDLSQLKCICRGSGFLMVCSAYSTIKGTKDELSTFQSSVALNGKTRYLRKSRKNKADMDI